MIFKDGDLSDKDTNNVTDKKEFTIEFSLQETGTAKLVFTIKKDGEALTLSDAVTGKLTLNMEDGSKFIDLEIITTDRLNGVVEYVLNDEQLNHSGKVIGELGICYEGNQPLCCLKFTFAMEKLLFDQNIEVSCEYFEELTGVSHEQAIQEKNNVVEKRRKVKEFDIVENSFSSRITDLESKIESIFREMATTVKKEEISKEVSNALGTMDVSNAIEMGNLTDPGTKPRTLSNSLSERGINVKDFGAKGDGVNDDTQAIKDSLVYARARNKGIYIPDGTYKITDTIVLKKGDYLYGQSAERTILKAFTPNMTVLRLTEQEGTVKNLFIYTDTSVQWTYTAIELRCSSYNVDNVKIFMAKRALYVPSRGCYINVFTNLFMYRVNFGLYCEDGIEFNGNRIHFLLLHGSAYDETGNYAKGDIGLRILGFTNEFTGGEIAGFEFGIETVLGNNNQFGSIYMEHNSYGFKNTSNQYQDVSKLHIQKVHPTGIETLRTENGMGTPGMLRPVGVRGFQPLTDAYFYYIFDELYDGIKTIYDYSGNNRHLVLNDLVSVSDWEGNFGTTKKLTFPVGQTAIFMGAFIDTTKPVTFVWSGKPVFNSGILDYTHKAFWLSGSNGSYIRAIQLSDGGISVEANITQGGFQFLFTANNGVNDSFSSVIIDFPNNKIYRVDLNGGNFFPIDIDLSDFMGGKGDLKLLWKDSTSGITDSTVEYVYNYFMAYPRALSFPEIIEFAKIKSHLKPLSSGRAYNSTTTITADATIPNGADTKVLHSKLLINDGKLFDVSNNRFTVPNGVKKVKLTAQCEFAFNATGIRQQKIFKNGTTFLGYPNAVTQAISLTNKTTMFQISSPVIEVKDGDYFEHFVYQDSGGDLALKKDTTWFTIQVVE